MAYGRHRYRITIKNQTEIFQVEDYLLRNNLITAIEGKPTPHMTADAVNVDVIVPNKIKFEKWYSPKKRFRETTDPIHLGFVIGEPIKLPDRPSNKTHKEKKSSKKGEEFRKLKKNFDHRK